MKDRMKNYLWAAFILCGSVAFQSCDKDDDDDNIRIPVHVQQAFLAQYPDAGGMEWEMEMGKYKVEFFDRRGQTTADAWYSTDGVWEKTEFNFLNKYYNQADSSISSEARAAIAAQLAGRVVEDLDYVDVPEPQKDYFLLEIDSEPNDVYVRIDLQGIPF